MEKVHSLWEPFVSLGLSGWVEGGEHHRFSRRHGQQEHRPDSSPVVSLQHRSFHELRCASVPTERQCFSLLDSPTAVEWNLSLLPQGQDGLQVPRGD